MRLEEIGREGGGGEGGMGRGKRGMERGHHRPDKRLSMRPKKNVSEALFSLSIDWKKDSDCSAS